MAAYLAVFRQKTTENRSCVTNFQQHSNFSALFWWKTAIWAGIFSLVAENGRWPIFFREIQPCLLPPKLVIKVLAIFNLVYNPQIIASIYPENYRVLRTSSCTNYALDPHVALEAISVDTAAGLLPFFLYATDTGMWFHIDAAYAGCACICPEYRRYLDGVEEADSFNMNPYKWFLTNFDCSVLWVKDTNDLVQSFSTDTEYLRDKFSKENTVIDYKDWEIPLGRRFRSLKLWMVFRLYGLENLQHYIRNHIKLAKHFEELVARDSRFEVVVPRTFALVCFRLVPHLDDPDNGKTLNYKLMDAVNSSGAIFISHTVLSGKFVLRFVVGAPLTEEKHVEAAWKVFQEQAALLLEGSPA